MRRRWVRLVTEVFLSLGSNIQRYSHLNRALDALQKIAPLRCSQVYESESVGFSGSLFLNMVVAFNTTLSIAELAGILRAIELDNGRVLNAPKFSPRTLDIDILTYGELCGDHAGVQLPRAEILYNAFVLLPLSELVPDARHPECAKTYRALWADYDNNQRLWPVPFRWGDRSLSLV